MLPSSHVPLQRLQQARMSPVAAECACFDGHHYICSVPAAVQPHSSAVWQNAQQQQQDPSHQQHTVSEEADPSVLAFATKVAQLLMQEISEHLPARILSVLTQHLQQQVTQQAADAAAAGKTFSTTATLQKLLPQLSQVAAHAAVLGPQLAAAEAAAASTARTPLDSSSAGAGQHTRVQLRNSQQQQQLQQRGSPGFESQQQLQHLGSPLSGLRSTAAPNHPHLASNACRKLAFEPAAAAGPAVGATAGYPFSQQQQQQQQVWTGPQWGTAPTCSECGSTCD